MKPRITIIRQMPLQEQIQIECEVDPKYVLENQFNDVVRPLLYCLDQRHREMSMRVANVVAYRNGITDPNFFNAMREVLGMTAGFMLPDPDVNERPAVVEGALDNG